MKTDYWILLATIGIALIALVFALCWFFEHSGRVFMIAKADGLEQEKKHLLFVIADRDQALHDAQAEINALEMRTVEMPEIPTQAAIPPRPKRPPRKKLEEQAS